MSRGEDTILTELVLSSSSPLYDSIYMTSAQMFFLQEVLFDQLSISAFSTFSNVASDLSMATALFYREGYPLKHFEVLHNVRGIGCIFRDLTSVLFAHSRSGRYIQSRFCEEEIIYLLRKSPTKNLLSGVFNSVLRPVGRSTTFNFSKEFDGIVRSLHIHSWPSKLPHHEDDVLQTRNLTDRKKML